MEKTIKKNNNYSNKPSLIPIISNNKTVTTVKFEPNLNCNNKPSYLNEGGNIGLCRIQKGRYRNRLVIMYEDEFYPSCNHGEFITENDAYNLCISRGKNMVIKKLNINPNYEEE